jgi:tRNA threonylcarbamoyladenosine biosynthesis protein TsaB
MLILSVDSSATPASVCLYRDGRVIAEYYIHTALTHSETLVAMIDSVLKTTGTKPSDIDYYAVNHGPGSFTGVRIGVSAVKGMAYAAVKPCIAVSTLESMAYNLLACDAVICACMDARRQQVYNALFRVKDGAIERLCEDRAIGVEELLGELSEIRERIILVGDGAELVKRSCPDDPHILLAPAAQRYQRASSTAILAALKAERGEVISSSALMPTYLRLSQAEREMQNKQKGESL